MIFEDLMLMGFRNVKKEIGLDYNHLEIAIKKLATWHAITSVMIVNVTMLSFLKINFK